MKGDLHLLGQQHESFEAAAFVVVVVVVVRYERLFHRLSSLAQTEPQLFVLGVERLSEHFHRLGLQHVNLLRNTCNQLPQVVNAVEVAAMPNDEKKIETIFPILFLFLGK